MQLFGESRQLILLTSRSGSGSIGWIRFKTLWISVALLSQNPIELQTIFEIWPMLPVLAQLPTIFAVWSLITAEEVARQLIPQNLSKSSSDIGQAHHAPYRSEAVAEILSTNNTRGHLVGTPNMVQIDHPNNTLCH